MFGLQQPVGSIILNAVAVLRIVIPVHCVSDWQLIGRFCSFWHMVRHPKRPCTSPAWDLVLWLVDVLTGAMKYTPTFSADEKQMGILYLKLGGNGLIYATNQAGASPSTDTVARAIATTHVPCTTAVTEEDLTTIVPEDIWYCAWTIPLDEVAVDGCIRPMAMVMLTRTLFSNPSWEQLQGQTVAPPICIAVMVVRFMLHNWLMRSSTRPGTSYLGTIYGGNRINPKFLEQLVMRKNMMALSTEVRFLCLSLSRTWGGKPHRQRFSILWSVSKMVLCFLARVFSG